MNIQWVGSPNHEKGRRNTKVDRVVIHWWGTAGSTLEGVGKHFQKVDGTSAHYSVSDSNVHQYVNTDDTAYHAGVFAMNLRSIGIEHDATTKKQLSELSYETSAKLIATLAQKYGIPLDREHIIKHSEVKSTQCCGTIDIDKLISLAKGGSMSDSAVLDKLRQEADDARKARDENWNRGEAFREQLEKANAIISDLREQNKTTLEQLSKSQEEVSRLNTKLVEVVKTSENKAESDLLVIDTLKKQLEGTQPQGALGYISLAVQAIIERRWN